MSPDLSRLPVLVVDGQTTGTSPAHGHLLELGWARVRAAQALDGLEPSSCLLALPEGATIPRPVEGRIAHREELEPDAALPCPPGWARSPRWRRERVDVATFDRLRVLTAELRRVLAEGRDARLCLGSRRQLGPERPRRAMVWV